MKQSKGGESWSDVIQSGYGASKLSSQLFKVNKESCILQRGRTALQNQRMREVGKEAEEAEEAEDMAEDGDVGDMEVDEVAAMSQVLPVTRARKYQDSARKRTRARARTTIVKPSEIRRWQEVVSRAKSPAISRCTTLINTRISMLRQSLLQSSS